MLPRSAFYPRTQDPFTGKVHNPLPRRDSSLREKNRSSPVLNLSQQFAKQVQLSHFNRNIPQVSTSQSTNSSSNHHEVANVHNTSSHSRLSSQSKDATKAAFKQQELRIEPLPWTEKETEKIVQQLEFLTEKVCEDRDRFPKEVVSQHLRTLQALIQQQNQSNLQSGNKKEQTRLARDDPLLAQVATTLRGLALVDLNKLTVLMQSSMQAEELLTGRDLLLLSGPSGCGKTTTLHFLAGTDFEEVEIEGFSHLEPRRCPDPVVAQYETSCCRYGVTRTLQTAQVLVDGKKYFVCDTPGLDTLDSVEEEIAFGIGTTRAMQKARTVRPVIVLCKDNLGHRFVNLDKSWGMVKNQFILGPDTGLKPFNYIFTKFDTKHRTRICQQFSHFKDDITNPNKSSKSGRKRYSSRNLRNSDIGSVEEGEVFKSFVEDIVEKSNPEANVVLPMIEKPEALLRSLVRNSYPVSDPMNFFAPLATEASLGKLQIQLEMGVHELTIALTREDYDCSVDCLQQLLSIARLMPEAQTYLDIGVQLALQHCSLLFHSLDGLLDSFDYATAIHRVHALQKLAAIVPSAKECPEMGEDLLCRSIVDALESRTFGHKYINLVQVGHLLKDFPKAHAGIQKGLQGKEARIRTAAAAGDCNEAAELLMQLIELAQTYPDAAPYVNNGYQALQKEIHRSIEDFKLEQSRDHLNLLATIVPHIPPAADFARNALRQLLNQIEKRVDENEYSVTVNLVQGLLELTDVFPDTSDCVNRGIQILWNIFHQVLDDKHYIRAIGIVEVISGLVKISPKAFEYTKLAIDILGDRLLRAIQDGNYNVAMKMLLHVTKLECEFPATLKSECVTHGLKMISQTADKAVKAKKYDVIHELFHDLMQLELEVPEAGRVARHILSLIQREYERTIHRRNFGGAIELLQQFSDLEEDMPEVREFIKRGQDVFLKHVKDTFETLEPLDCLKLIDMLLLSEPRFFTAGECARHGLKRFRDVMEETIDQHDYVSASEMWNELYQLSLKHPKVKKTVQSGFILLREALAASLSEQNYKAATFIIQHFGKVECDLPEADKCARQSLTVIRNAITASIDQAAYGTAIDILQMLVNSSKDFPDAFQCAQYGIKQLHRAVETTLMDKKDYRKAIEMMDKSIRLSEELPEALACAQGGLKIVVKANEMAIKQGDYGLAVDLLNQVHNLKQVLPEAHLCCEIGLQAAVKNLTWLRVAVKSVVDQLGPNVPLDRFAGVVRELKSLLQSIMKAEPLRYLCIKLHTESLEEELPNGEDFITEELRKLTETVVAELLNVEINKSCSSSLIKMRSSLLSTLMRLKVMSEQLYQCPGGELVSAAYDEAFNDFYVLLDSVLKAAESRTRLPEATGMDIFELQAAFLQNIITGFHETDLEITDYELVQIEGLERRRVDMMHQFENQIESAKEMLDDFSSPLNFQGNREEASFTYIQNLDLSIIVEPRRSLLALGKSPSLCAMLSKRPKPTDFTIYVKRFDLLIVDLMEKMIAFLESEHSQITQTEKGTTDLVLIEKMSSALIEDIKKISDALGFVTKWSDEVENRCRPHQLRLYKLKQGVTETLSRVMPEVTGGFLNPFQCFCARAVD